MTYVQLKTALTVLGIVDVTTAFVVTLKSGTQYKGTLAPGYFLEDGKGLNIPLLRGRQSCISMMTDGDNLGRKIWHNVMMTSEIVAVAREFS